MKVWNKLIDKFDLLLMKVKLGSTVKIGGRDIPPVFMGLALIIICIPIWGYLESEGDNKYVGALVAILMHYLSRWSAPVEPDPRRPVPEHYGPVTSAGRSHGVY